MDPAATPPAWLLSAVFSMESMGVSASRLGAGGRASVGSGSTGAVEPCGDWRLLFVCSSLRRWSKSLGGAFLPGESGTAGAGIELLESVGASGCEGSTGAFRGGGGGGGGLGADSDSNGSYIWRPLGTAALVCGRGSSAPSRAPAAACTDDDAGVKEALGGNAENCGMNLVGMGPLGMGPVGKAPVGMAPVSMAPVGMAPNMAPVGRPAVGITPDIMGAFGNPLPSRVVGGIFPPA